MPPSPSKVAPDYLLKLAIYLSFAVMLFSGLSWLILDNFFQYESAVGLQKHPWQSAVLSLHGFSSYFFSIIFGFTLASHVAAAWNAKRYRSSGNIIIALALTLITSGAAFLFFPPGNWKEYFEWIHIAAGMLLLISIIFHVRIARKTSIRRHSIEIKPQVLS